MQGISISGECYGALPTKAAALVAAQVPAPCTRTNPLLLEAYRASCDGHSQAGEVFIEDLVLRAGVTRSLVASAVRDDLSDKKACVGATFEACVSDAERLVLLDMTALDAAQQSFLVVDDGQFRTSSIAAAGLVADALTEYAVTSGAVYPTGHKAKCTVVPDSLSEAGKAELSTP